MLRKLSLPLLAIFSLSQATEVTISGVMSADIENNLDASWKAHNSANQDITLTTRAQFDEKAAVELYITNYSTVTDSATGVTRASVVRSVEPGRSAEVANPNSRWGTLAFDGIQFQWEFLRKAKLLVGDMTYYGGSMNYYGYRWTQEYGTILKETYLRGLGFDLGGDGQIYVGAPDANNSAVWGYAGYSIPILKRTDEKFMIRPMGDLVFKNGGRQNRWTLGAETQYSRSISSNLNYGVSGAWGMIPYQNKSTHTFLVEPSIGYKEFSLAGTYYQALPSNKDSSIALQTSIPEEQFVSIEPSFSPHPKFSFGLGGEFHNPNKRIKGDDYFATVPTFYLYPAEKMSITFWTKYQWMMQAADVVKLGLSSEVKF